jgi:ABC-type Mn2+/Zn2+ transport system ATPase subunit
MIATHDVEQARAWGLVLCINRRQIAFGPANETLTLSVLEATHGSALVRLPQEAGDEENGGEAALVPPHHHHHDHP